MLDPRISYEGLLSDCDNDRSAISLLNLFKDRLHAHYLANYAKGSSAASTPTQTAPSISSGSPQKVDFTARYKKARMFVDELEEYFKLPLESFDRCDPIQWWASRHAQFPNLSRLARDILSIPGVCFSTNSFVGLLLNVYPGSAVAVEWIFSGGRDTISLRRASLKPETIRTLMLVKQRLRLAREAIQDILGD